MDKKMNYRKPEDEEDDNDIPTPVNPLQDSE